MRLQITHMKAPWPAGACVGDVLELPVVPAWAMGKCVQVGDGVTVTIGVKLADDGDGAGDALPSLHDIVVGTIIDAIASGGPVAQAVLRAEPDPVEVFVPLAAAEPIDAKPKAKK